MLAKTGFGVDFTLNYLFLPTLSLTQTLAAQP